MARRTAPLRCPHCSAHVPPRALACPECGSDAASGWSENADSWAGDLPDGYGGDEFDDEAYEELLREEGLTDDGRPSARARRRAWRTTLAWLIVAAMLAAWLLR